MGEDEKINLKKSSSTNSGDLEIRSEKIVVSSSESPAGNKISATDIAVGGGTGGIVVVLADLFVSDPHLRQLAQIIAPTVSLVILHFYRWLSGEISEFYKEWKQERSRLKFLGQAEAALSEARIQLREVSSDSDATPDEKTAVRVRVQRIEKSVLNLKLKGILILD